jgi:hypothetical protein
MSLCEKQIQIQNLEFTDLLVSYKSLGSIDERYRQGFLKWLHSLR